MGRAKIIYLSCYLLAMVMAVLVISCGPKAMQPLSRLDTPEHHTSTGIKLLHAGEMRRCGT